MLTDAQIREWTEACEDASPDWVRFAGNDVRTGDGAAVRFFERRVAVRGQHSTREVRGQAEKNMTFAIAARTALPLLLADRRRLIEGLAWLQSALTPPQVRTGGIVAAVDNLLAGRAWDGTEVG